MFSPHNIQSVWLILIDELSALAKKIMLKNTFAKYVVSLGCVFIE